MNKELYEKLNSLIRERNNTKWNLFKRIKLNLQIGSILEMEYFERDMFESEYAHNINKIINK